MNRSAGGTAVSAVERNGRPRPPGAPLVWAAGWRVRCDLKRSCAKKAESGRSSGTFQRVLLLKSSGPVPPPPLSCCRGHLGLLRVRSSTRRRPGRRPAAARPAGSSEPGCRSPTAPESGGSSPPAPQRHTGPHLWSLRWPLNKNKNRRIRGFKTNKKKTNKREQKEG